MSDGQSISVNFSREIPIFPLAGVVLLPQQVLPLHIFEPRYRQMVSQSLDGSGQIAMAVVDEDKLRAPDQPTPIKPAVCVGQIVQHETLPDGRYNILLQGICRARIISESLPNDKRLYRAARLQPLGEANPDAAHLTALRSWIEEELTTGPLRQLPLSPHIVEYIRDTNVPNAAVFELVSFALFTEPMIRYRLLCEPNLDRRASIIEHELRDLASIITHAESHKPTDWPKGCSWN